MNVEQRVDLLERLRMYISSDGAGWNDAKKKAEMENPWFIPAFINYQLSHITSEYLDRKNLEDLVRKYDVPTETASPKNVGIVMAGNIPLAGFHDFLCVFLSGHRQVIKPSSKDFALIAHIVNKLNEWDPAAGDYFSLADRLKGCDAYVATGSNNSSRYFDYYFNRYPHMIRRNRTSVAILDGNETEAELDGLADDVYLYFGLGCRNVTKLYVPGGYDFVPLLSAFKKYNWTFDIHKYKNNYDYQLAIMIINKIFYMTEGSILLVENRSLFSPVSQLHYEFYQDRKAVEASLENNGDIQCVVSRIHVPFGRAQKPDVRDYADKADTLQFLREL